MLVADATVLHVLLERLGDAKSSKEDTRKVVLDRSSGCLFGFEMYTSQNGTWVGMICRCSVC